MKLNKAVLLVNIGSPDSPSKASVRKYLRQFLMDPFVLNINPVLRWLLVHLLILPRRPKKSAKAYQKIWTEQGSPLVSISKSFAVKLQDHLTDVGIKVFLGMRYGTPSIDSAANAIAKTSISDILVVPMFPQYATASTKSAEMEVLKCLGKKKMKCNVTFIQHFFKETEFLDAWSHIILKALSEFQSDFVLFSYHGLPVNQCAATDPSGSWCTKREDCCLHIRGENALCYRHQCFETTRLLIQRLGIDAKKTMTAFQSRLGRTPWIKPYTDQVLDDLRSKGVKNLAVISPSFVADCLETLEEIGLRLREDWIQRGGESLLLVPSLNDSQVWVDGLSAMIKRMLPSDP